VLLAELREVAVARRALWADGAGVALHTLGILQANRPSVSTAFADPSALAAELAHNLTGPLRGKGLS
jgi:hypothetical protein